MSLLTSLWDRRSKLICAACGGRFLSGVVRFDNGRKAGSLCRVYADSRVTEIGGHRGAAQELSRQSK
jgi:hypothetical protein